MSGLETEAEDKPLTMPVNMLCDWFRLSVSACASNMSLPDHT